MALRMRDFVVNSFGELRYEPTPRRVRAWLAGRAVVDSSRAVLVWEPRRVIPYYAVPAADIDAELAPLDTVGGDGAELVTLAPEGTDGTSIVRPGRFGGHTAAGSELILRLPGGDRPGAAFRLTDPELDGLVGLDFDAFDHWLEEEDRVVAHPRDPFHRVDVRRSSRRIRIELDGEPLAESGTPRLLFETHLPVRFYLPPDDVDLSRLRPSPTRTICAYKGAAEYLSPAGEDSVGAGRAGNDPAGTDLAWSYRQPLPEAAEIAGMIAFFDERVDVWLDGQPRERPQTPWSRR